MPTYKAPVEDALFLINDVFHLERYGNLPGFAEATSDTIDISNRIQGRVERDLQAQGYPVVRSPYGFGFAAVHAIRVHEDGLDGGADPGHDGVVIAV